MEALVDHISQYCRLNNAAFKGLRDALHKTELAKGSFLIKEGKICDHVYFLEKGCLRGYYNLDGKEISHWFAF